MEIDQNAAAELARDRLSSSPIVSPADSVISVKNGGEEWVVVFSPKPMDQSSGNNLVLGGPGAEVSVNKSDGSTKIVYTQ